MERASDAYAMMRRIAELLEGGVREARVFVLADGLSTARGIERQTVANVSVTFEIYDRRRLTRTMATGQTREVIELEQAERGVQPIAWAAMQALDGKYEPSIANPPDE